MIIGIIGAGASGMAAALAASENLRAQVLLFERQARVGRKLQATGNGRCNLTNTHALEGGYHGNQEGFWAQVLGAFGPEETRSWFWQLGLYTVEEPSGKVYPYSDQANSVVDVLRLALQKENIVLHTGVEIEKIRSTPDGFALTAGAEVFHCDRLIIACGGLAGTKLGGTMSGYKLLAKLGHRSTRLRPALVQLRCGWPGVVALKGVRANCHVELMRDQQVFSQSTGELQFTETGLSGPVIFESSRDVCQGPGRWWARLDFLPEISTAALLALLEQRSGRNLPMEDLLTGLLHNRLGRVLTKAAGLRSTGTTGALETAQLQQLCSIIKAFPVDLTEPMGMDSAQVTAGGVLTEDFDPLTMESRKIPGLYACGEVLDVDGDCGGYNLQWAWSSGRAAGLHAGKEPV